MNTASPSLGHDVARLQNVFKKLTVQNHPLRDQALRFRDEISLSWLRLAEKNEWFAWPSTSVSRGRSNGKFSRLDWRPQGMLSLLGYHVGETLSLHPSIRESILEYAFEHHLPPIGDAIYFGVADKLFATLDTTVRALQPEMNPRVLVSDTVGFIKKLPHDLVASFRSTLAEALEASQLLFVVRLRADCAILSVFAAALNPPRSATATKYRSCLKSMRHPISSRD
jgi:hypothetical protein